MKMNDSEPNRKACEAAERGEFSRITLREFREDIRGDRSSQSKSWGWLARHPQQLIISLFFVGLVQGCEAGGPEAVGNRFMDAYYVSADLGQALKLSEGLAAKKIRDQQQLTKGESGPQTSQGRRVSYNLIDRNTVDGKLFFRYEVRIEVQGVGSLTRKALLAMEQEPNGWRVTNFIDMD